MRRRRGATPFVRTKLALLSEVPHAQRGDLLMARPRRRLLDRPSSPPVAPVLTVDPVAVRLAQALADGDLRRLRVVHEPRAIGGAALVVLNNPQPWGAPR